MENKGLLFLDAEIVACHQDETYDTSSNSVNALTSETSLLRTAFLILHFQKTTIEYSKTLIDISSVLVSFMNFLAIELNLAKKYLKPRKSQSF